MNSATDALPRVKSVTAVRGAPWTLNVVWDDDKRSRVDLTGLVHRSRHFKVFLNDAAAFRTVRVIDFGGGIAWDNGLDYGADTLKTMAEEQRRLTGADLVQFESAHDLSTAETATMLGLAERTVRAYRSRRELPQTIAISLRMLWSSSTRLAAHYRPAGQRKPGRPASTASKS